MAQNSINDALRAFEATEANLAKMETLWSEIKEQIPKGIAFVDTDGDYEDKCRAFRDLHSSLPKIDGYSMEISLPGLNEIAQMRFDALECGEPLAEIAVDEHVFQQAGYLKEYKYVLDKARRKLVRRRLLELLDHIDATISAVAEDYPYTYDPISKRLSDDERWQAIRDAVSEIDQLLGSSLKRPKTWPSLQRHLYFGMVGDFNDIRKHDWPPIKTSLTESMYGETDPIPVGVEDLGALVESRPSGALITRLNWSQLSDDEFERLIYSLISQASGYENPEWLTKTNAPDRGRDLSVTRVQVDSLGGTVRQRVIIQCKHWLSKSVGLTEITSAEGQMKLWSPPAVDVLTVATTGRFTTDAIEYVERNNLGDSRLRIEMWPESHLEKLLAKRPALIAQFKLR